MADQDNTIGANAWVGNSVSGPSGNKDIPLSSDMPPLSGKSVTSVPEEHRFDRVPPPMKNTNPTPAFPKPGEALDNAMRRMADQQRAAETPQAPIAQAPIERSVTEVAPQRAEVGTNDKETVFKQVRSGTPFAIYDETVIPLIDKGLVRLELGPSGGGMREVVAVSTKDDKPLRSVGFARGTESTQTN